MAKIELSQRAEEHTALMDKTYNKEIEESYRNSVIYRNDFQYTSTGNDIPKITMLQMTTQDAIWRYENSKILVLNFASYKNPGGAFWRGSYAQEEALCHESFLYNVLRKHTEYYDWNNKHLNRALYTNAALLTPDVLFFKAGDVKKVDVLSCAAPNITPVQRYHTMPWSDVVEAVSDRCFFLCKILNSMVYDVIILGAWGCGVFRNDPCQIAQFLKSYLCGNQSKEVVFAIPDGKNFNKFKQILVG